MFLVSSCNGLCSIHWSQVLVENEDVVGAAPTGDAPTTSELSTILLPTNVRLILEVLRYYICIPVMQGRSTDLFQDLHISSFFIVDISFW